MWDLSLSYPYILLCAIRKTALRIARQFSQTPVRRIKNKRRLFCAYTCYQESNSVLLLRHYKTWVKCMTEKKSVTFRCEADLLEAIDNLGRERYPAKTPHGYDRSKILMEVLRLNIEALSDGSVVLPTPAEVRRQPSGVRHKLSDRLLDERITEMLTRKTEPILAELADIKASQADAIERAKAELRTELLGELVA